MSTILGLLFSVELFWREGGSDESLTVRYTRQSYAERRIEEEIRLGRSLI